MMNLTLLCRVRQDKLIVPWALATLCQSLCKRPSEAEETEVAGRGGCHWQANDKGRLQDTSFENILTCIHVQAVA